ncbi:prosaposin [Genypterus blacodes]|uniref:prosaposin n=1 Tax=Genypterus blacodes TaxID=154954 RepID=UPI003F759177
MLLLALLFVSSAVATPLLGTEQCARGPPYWCKNVKTASLCGAVSHCQQNVWNQPQMKTVPCDLCKEVLMVVEQLLKNNATQAEILGYLEKACQLIPDQGLTAECKEMVDSYYPIIIGIITGELEDPAVVCGAMGLCQSQQAALAHIQKQLLSNEIPQVDLAEPVAPFLLNVPQLLYPQESPKEEAPKVESPKQGNGAICEDCIKFLTDAKEEAKKNETFLSSLIELIEQQCDHLGPGLAEMCKEYIGQYAPKFLDEFMSMEPKDLCCRAGLCDAVKKSIPLMTLQAAKAVPASKMFPATRVEATPAKPMVRTRDSPKCAICEFVMTKLESMLEDQTTEEEVVHAVQKVCSLLPASVEAQCKDLVEAYGRAIIELLIQQADPKTICTALALCNDASRTHIPVMDQAQFKNGAFCELCKTTIRYLDVLLEANATKDKIEDAVRRVCSFLPNSVQTECDQLVTEYEPQLVQLLLQMMDPDFVCMKLEACPEAGQRLLGSERCSWGPGFWCKNMQTASMCNAVAHCKRHVWV